MESNRKEIQDVIDLMITNQDVRRKLARENFRLFFGAYFSHYIKCEFAPFHMEMFQLAQDEKNKTIVIMGARNSAKSAIMNTALSIWSILGIQQKKYVIIASKTQPKAKQHFMNMRRELETNRLLWEDLGPMKTDESEWGSVITIPKYDAKIIFASVEQSLRGERYKQYRPDLLILDDIEDNNSVRTIDGRNQTYDWVVQDAIPGGDLGKLRVVLLGTLLHDDSVMMRFKKDITLKKRDGVYREYPLRDASGVVLWKGKYPTEAAVEAERLMIGNDKAWSQEFLLRIVSDHERVVHDEWIQRCACPPTTTENKYRGTYISIDPAVSEDKKAACTAMIVVSVFGWGKDLKIYVHPFPVNEHLTWPAAVERAKALSDKYGRAKIYVEVFGMQKGLEQSFEAAGYPVMGLRPQGDKRTRLAAISQYIKDGTIQFAPRGNEELIMQVVNFGSEQYMDLADALSMVVPELVSSQQGYHPFSIRAIQPARPEKGEEKDYISSGRDYYLEGYRSRKKPITAGMRDMIF